MDTNSTTEWKPDYKDEEQLSADTSELDNRGFSNDTSVKQIVLGAGDYSANVDINGLYLGAAQFARAPFRVDMKGNCTATSLTLTGGTIKYGKTSFADNVNAGYWIGASGIYVGAAADASKLKYDIGTGAFDFIGTISSRSTLTLANSINASGQLVSDIVNAKIDSSAKTILSDFNFGTTDYAGAVKTGDITWNTTTGAITGGSGVVVYRLGIVGATAGVATFSIDATTGNANFAGTLSAASGTLGTITAGTIDGCDIYANNFRYKKNTIMFLLGSSDGWVESLSAGCTVTRYASNQIRLTLSSDLDETSYAQIQGSSVLLINSANDLAVLWDYDPMLEFWAKTNNTGVNPTTVVRMGPVNVDNQPSFGWKFLDDGVGTESVCTSYYDDSLVEGSILSGVSTNQWHKYRIQVTKTSADHYTVKWYINDTERQSTDIALALANPGEFLGIKLKNNCTDDTESGSIMITMAEFQSKYS